jgi:hypothetical protein
MSTERIENELRSANPIPRPTLAGLELAAGESALGEAIVAEPPGDERGAPRLARPRRRRSALFLAAGALAAVAAAGVVLLVGGGASESPPAYGAELVRFAESTPLLLLEGPGWRVQDVSEAGHSPYRPRGSGGEGSMEFVTGRPIPYESIRVTGSEETGWRESGMFPAAVRQRKVELSWRHGSLRETVSFAHRSPHPHGQQWTKLPVLDTTADVDTRAEFYVNQGGPGDRQMTAYWSEGGYLLELRAAVPDLAAFEERLDWLTRVGSQTWLDAMPAKVVKAADHDAAVREMLKGIPVPDGFSPSQIPDEGLTTNRYQVGASVAGVVSCLWFRQWGEARRSGDGQAEAEAEKAMATAKHWAILQEMAKEGAYPEVVWELAKEMPSGVRRYGPHRWQLLPQAEGLGCARWGIPVLPWKQRLQRERRQRQAPQ